MIGLQREHQRMIDLLQEIQSPSHRVVLIDYILEMDTLIMEYAALKIQRKWRNWKRGNFLIGR